MLHLQTIDNRVIWYCIFESCNNAESQHDANLVKEY